MENKVNINSRIRVQLTKDGAKAFNIRNLRLIDELLSSYPKVDCDFLKTDYKEGDVVEDSLWNIFSMLGNYFDGNTNAPFVNNEIEFLN